MVFSQSRENSVENVSLRHFSISEVTTGRTYSCEVIFFIGSVFGVAHFVIQKNQKDISFYMYRWVIIMQSRKCILQLG